MRRVHFFVVDSWWPLTIEGTLRRGWSRPGVDGHWRAAARNLCNALRLLVGRLLLRLCILRLVWMVFVWTETVCAWVDWGGGGY